jgi:anti-sigma factor RsiW
VHQSGPRHDGHAAGELSVIADEISCQEFVELITDYFEGALAPRTQAQVEEHLVMCDWCVTYVDHMEATIASLRALRGPPPVPDLPESVLVALRARKAAGA